MKKIILIPIGLIVLLFGILFLAIIGANPHTASVAFSLNDPNASYTITKHEGLNKSELPNYMVSYHTKKDGIEVEVGDSKVPLESYVGKKIHINGIYNGRVADKQCIVNVCDYKVGGAAIDITSVQLVK